MKIETFSAEETYKIGEQMGREAKAGDVLCLLGDLGVGKTVFTQGFAAGLGITEPVSSPTFTIVQTYDEGRIPFYHFDVYRIGDVEEMEEIGFDEYIFGEGVCLIEWANLIEEILPPHYQTVRIEKVLEKGFDYRMITIEAGRRITVKILVLESSGLVASVAVVTEEKLIGEYTTNFKKTHSQTLLPMMDTLLKMIGIPVQEMDAIAVSGGPGSFTGLRIGSATAKGLGLALSIPIISVPTVDAIAYNLCGTDAVVCPLMDARRNQTYTGLYTFDGDQMKCISGQKAVMLGEIIDEINQLGRKVIFLGDGVPVFKPYIEEHIQVPHSYAPIHLSQQRAGALGALALQYYHEGKYESAAEHQPDYLRLSQAERELAAKKGQEKA